VAPPSSVLSKHFVVRSMKSAAEYAVIDAELPDLSEAVRTEVRRARLQHKTSTVFLHEIGHTLGALHQADATTIMNPMYGQKVQAFSPDAVHTMQVVLEVRRQPDAQQGPSRNHPQSPTTRGRGVRTWARRRAPRVGYHGLDSSLKMGHASRDRLEGMVPGEEKSP
jgi:hypothetical protein